MSEFILNDLPVDHVLRNTPLAEIGAEYRWVKAKTWRRVLPSFRIATVSYNALGEVWTQGWIWRVKTGQ